MPSRNRIALSATIHCLTGCAIGEVLGMVIGTAAGWGNGATVGLSIVLAFASGYALTTRSLLVSGVPVAQALRLALAADTISIAIMEVVDNALMLVIPGAMDAGVGSALFWGSLAVSLVAAGIAAFPANRWLIDRGRGHALVHAAHDAPDPHGSHDAHAHHALVAALVGAAILATAAVAPPANALTLTRHPWIALRTTTSVLIAWQTDAPAPGKVLYAADPLLGWDEASQDPPDRVDHAVTLSNLAPDTYYFYRIVCGADTLTIGADYFKTAPVEPTPFRFLAFGDLGARTAAQFDIAARIDTLNADLALLTGDIIYELGEAQNFSPQYFDVYRKTIRRIPFYPSLGNHDEYSAGGQGYLDAFYLPSNNPAGTERYYSFDYGNAHFVALEVIAELTTPSAAMRTWLDQDLAATSKEWKFVFFHVPMYSNPGVHGDDAVIAAALGPIFESRGVDVVFQGHNHFYTRTYPISGGTAVDAAQEPDYFNPAAPIYIVTGGGGKSLYSLVTPWLAYEAFSKSAYHVTVVDVDGGTLSLLAVERDGTVMDAMTITKDNSTAVTVSAFEASGDAEGVRVRWRASGALGEAAFHVYRAAASGGAAERLTQGGPLTGGPDFEFLDRTTEPGVSHAYRLGVIEDGVETPTGWIEGARGAPYRFAMGRPRPNPARGASEIPFTLARRSPVRALIVDIHGRVVREIDTGALAAGPNSIHWDGRDRRGRRAPSGVYFAVVRAGQDEARARFTLLR